MAGKYKSYKAGFVKLHASKVIDGCDEYLNWYKEEKKKNLAELLKQEMEKDRNILFGFIKRPKYTEEQAHLALSDENHPLHISYQFSIPDSPHISDLVVLISELKMVAEKTLEGWADPMMDIDIHIARQFL